MTHTLHVKAFSEATDMAGRIKAIVYGPKFPATSISVDAKEFTKLFKDAGESSVITLKGLDTDQDVLIHDIQKNVVKGNIVHADLYVVQKGQKLKVHVPLVFIGVAGAVKTNGANLVKVLHEIEVEADAKHLPHEIEVDVSVLAEIDDQILVSDLKVGSGVKILTAETDLIALASKPVEEKEEESTEIDMASIEVEKKGKKDEEESAE
ncbi:MAG: 50S ribosomal protein L25 [Patescibacteria group bacterium]